MTDFRFQGKDMGKWNFSALIDTSMPPDYKRHVYDRLRWEVGEKLFSILEQNKNPAVVEIGDLEERFSCGSWGGGFYPRSDVKEISIEVRVTPVEHRHVTMVHQELPPIIEPMTLFQRLKWALFRKT